MPANDGLSIRRARPEDTERVLALINLVWPGDIRERRPWLFTPQRMGDYLLCFGGEELWGTVGAYPYDVRLGGVTFRMAGIGQVITHPERRGLGIMKMLMGKALADMLAQGLDAAWLLGDRLRYSHFGFVDGGRSMRYVTRERYLPAAAEPVRALDPVGDLDRVLQAINGQTDTALVPPEELSLMLQGWGVQGWALGGSLALFTRKGDRMVAASGNAEEVALLLAHQAAANARQEGGPREITFDAPCSPCMLTELGRRVHAYATVACSASIRIVTLRTFLEKAAKAVAARVPRGTDALSLRNMDTGEVITLRAARRRIRVLPGCSEEPVALNTLQLNEAVLDWLPAAARLPALAAESPLRVLFPLDFHMPWLSAVLV